MNAQQIKQAEQEQSEDCKKYGIIRSMSPEDKARLEEILRSEKPRRFAWLRRLMWVAPISLIILSAINCYGVTFFYNQYGQITGQWSWPEKFNVWVFRPDIDLRSPILPLPPRTPYPQPNPTPCPR